MKNIFHIILKLIWEPFSLKESHFWNWKDYTGQINESLCIEVSGDLSKKPRVNFFTNLLYTNFIWSKVAVLSNSTDEQIYFGFISPEENKIQYCNILINLGEKVGFLLGHHPFRYFAINTKDEQVLFTLLKTSTKKDCKIEKIRIM